MNTARNQQRAARASTVTPREAALGTWPLQPADRRSTAWKRWLWRVEGHRPKVFTLATFARTYPWHLAPDAPTE